MLLLHEGRVIHLVIDNLAVPVDAAALNAASLEATVPDDEGLANHVGDLRLDRVLAVTSLDAVGGDQRVEEARHDEGADDEDHDKVEDDEAVQEGRVLVVVVVEELGVRKREDQADGRGRDVLEDDGPGPVKLPVLAGEDGGVEIVSELVALFSKSCG